jgi:ABC-2 type transport system permease protein
MKTLLVARKNLIEVLREGQLLALVLFLPLVFLLLTAFAYNAPLSATHPVQVLDPDARGEPLLQELRALRYDDGRPVFDVTPATDRDAAEAALKERDVTALLIVAPGDAADSNLQVTLKGDALYGRFYRASTILNDAARRYADRLAGRPERVRVVKQALVAAGPQTEFDLYAPSMIIFALVLIIPQTAMLAAREVRWRTLKRLRLTRLRAWELLGGMSLAQMVVAVGQVVIMFLGALALGFNNQGSLWLAVVVGLVISFSAIGLGLIVACFVANDSQATNAGSTLSMALVFLSGGMYPLPPLTLFTLAGHQIDLFDVFPTTHGFLALKQVLSYGAGLREIGFRLGATLLLSVLYLAAGVFVFQRLQMRERAE